MATRKATRREGGPLPPEPAWAGLSDDELLDLRFCDLRLTLRGTAVERHVAGIRRGLERRGLRFRPHLWLSEEWFSPDGVPGIAVPFYMAHPRLARLERRAMREAEGRDAKWLRGILRHEIGHALDNAFRLRRRKLWRAAFGRASTPYRDVYRARPSSRDFVLHLDRWYAQSHPCEDFAETFAVWLEPRARWRRDYRGWPALRKLLYVDALMDELRGQRPAVVNRVHIEPLSENRLTLGEHYRRQRARRERDAWDAHDRRLERVFGGRRDGERRLRASTFLRRHRPELERGLTDGSGWHPYLVEQVLRRVIQRSHELELHLHTPQREALGATLGMLRRILTETVRRDRERYTR